MTRETEFLDFSPKTLYIVKKAAGDRSCRKETTERAHSCDLKVNCESPWLEIEIELSSKPDHVAEDLRVNLLVFFRHETVHARDHEAVREATQNVDLFKNERPNGECAI